MNDVDDEPEALAEDEGLADTEGAVAVVCEVFLLSAAITTPVATMTNRTTTMIAMIAFLFGPDGSKIFPFYLPYYSKRHVNT